MGYRSEELLPLWTRYVEDRSLSGTEIDPVIYQSWKRSSIYNVDPYQIEKNDILEECVLQERLQANESLIKAAEISMVELYSVLKGSGITIVLADLLGYILQAYTDDSFFQQAQTIALAPGANWSERIKGTNAIGTALAEAKPVNIIAHEHYCRENHFLACSAVPIFGVDNQIIGVLDVTGDYRLIDEKIMGMLRLTAKNVQHQVTLSWMERELSLSKMQYAGMMELVTQGLVSVDDMGFVRNINLTGAKHLGLPPEECIGKPLSELFNLNKSWTFSSGNQDGNMFNLSAKKKSGVLNTKTKQLFSDDGTLKGVVASFQPKEDMPHSRLLGMQSRYSFDDIITYSSTFQDLINTCRRVADSESSVLVLGETGTGKEIIAQAIHQESSRSDRPFVAVNCASLPAELLESELFGYEEGAFTGAKKGGSPGKFELAQGGTIFLDEIGDMPLSAQVSLLRVLQEKQIVRLGGSKVTSIDVRVIAATHQNIFSKVEQNKFRQDLFYRLNVVTLKLPPLRQRREDIIPLAEHFLVQLKQKLGRGELILSAECKKVLEQYSWPGNVRELENTIEGIVNLVEGNIIGAHDLPEHIHAKQNIVHNDSGSIREAEKQAILRAISTAKGNMSKSAKLLGVGRTTLYRKLKEYQIEVEQER